MAWQIELTSEAKADLEAAEEHHFAVALAFGNGVEEASDMAARRIRRTLAALNSLSVLPHVGTRHDDLVSGLRHVTKSGAILWFVVDAETRHVRVTGIFHGGQDHLGRMLARLTAEGGA